MNSIKILLVSIFLCNISFVKAQEQERDWVPFSQILDLEVKKDLVFELTASVKVDVKEPNSQAGLWARVDNKGKTMGFFDNMSDRPIKDSTWKTYSIKGILDSKAKRLVFGGLVYGNGSFYYDDFKLSIENPKTGKMEEVAIDNSGFEEVVANSEIPKWWIGISKEAFENTAGFSMNSSDESSEGNHSLKIEGKNITRTVQNYIGPIDGYSPQIGTLVTMLNNLSERVEYAVGNMSQAELDYQLDEKSNSVGALIMHLAATETYFQEATFGESNLSEAELEELRIAMELGDEGRQHIKGHDATYYLDIYKKARKRTLELLKEKDDAWLAEVPEGSTVNNHFSWFHVMEHQSSHLGQILLLQKRIPETKTLDLKNDKKVD
ncbi:Protein of unknown function (DUF664) [Aequorivita sublithincola DSM 14238]|uniref:DinB-like domain-containing protein n=1 Tax=Aequorivita sublithincola (strain DSM 14238 / LMG 21431 / ACAM 643 / 9-3) TaxID=746697 RepID=I3YTA9_AEQSU|nr:DinB family protein [Aequorivita sublithincola]AFL80227.1 Protein of unknown function (DUF664) [Aequorivita sublithincola DSM 14238]